MFFQPKSYRRRAVPMRALASSAVVPEADAEQSEDGCSRNLPCHGRPEAVPEPRHSHPFAITANDETASVPTRHVTALPAFDAPSTAAAGALPPRSSSFRFHTPTPSRSRTSYESHSTAPSFSSLSSIGTAATSRTGASDRSIDSYTLTTPIKEQPHSVATFSPEFQVKRKPVPPSRPLPPLPPCHPDSAQPKPLGPRPHTPPSRPARFATWSAGRSARSRSPFASRGRSPPPPPPPLPDIAIYASMPLPPVPTIGPGQSHASGIVGGLTVPRTYRRDSQATVRPADGFTRRVEHRDTLRARPRPLPLITTSNWDDSVLDTLGIGQCDGTEIWVNEAQFHIEGWDFGDFELDAFPLPPDRCLTRDSGAGAPMPSSPLLSVSHGVPVTQAKSKPASRSSSMGISVSRKAPPPPLPALSFDVISLDRERTGRSRRAGR